MIIDNIRMIKDNIVIIIFVLRFMYFIFFRREFLFLDDLKKSVDSTFFDDLK